jgi:hypothetical protein
VQRQIVERQRQQARIDSAADILAEMERALRLDCREQIHIAERRLRALSAATAWTEWDWLIASLCHCTLERNLAACTLLSFGALAERARYTLQPKSRAEVEFAIRLAGGVRDENGRWVEFPQ